MYDATRQYRCTIIRGKAKKEMDDLLPAYALVIDEVCPCQKEEFVNRFNDDFKQYLPIDKRGEKTLDNHRTEICGKLFGMYYLADDDMVYESERTQKYLEDNDQPAFFKDICYKMQFPNGMQKPQTIIQLTKDNINIRPNAFLMKFLMAARNAKIDITKKDVGYYILNSLDVLQGKASPYEVLDALQEDKQKGIIRDIKTPGKASSYDWQHINEQMNYLELANLIRIIDGRVILNTNEMDTIKLFADDWDKTPEFDVYSYNLNTQEGRDAVQLDWDFYFSKLSPCADKFTTTVNALNFENVLEDIHKKEPEKIAETQHQNLTEFGDEGEQFAYEYERDRVGKFDKKLLNKILMVGKQKGLGYDIQSVIAEPGAEAEFAKYIEVKSTKRTTSPDINDSSWIDTLNITRKEWIAARQFHDFYYIYRIYFTSNGVSMFILGDPYTKEKNHEITITPMTYRIDFSNKAVDAVMKE